MDNQQIIFYPFLQTSIQRLLTQFELIPPSRKALLDQLASYVMQKENPALNFICTHNSRRSHIAQIWAAVASAWFGLEKVSVYSGGTEATAFNPRAVAALERVGFRIENPGHENPAYRVSFAENQAPLICFSKTYDDPINPTKDFAAIMTCSDADENCPFIPGAAFRLSLTYEDPKKADDSPEEAQRYDERVSQIGRELFYAFSQVK